MPSITPSPGPRAARSVVVRDLSVSYPDRTVLSGIDLVAQPGRRIGLVGENGAGKSTLLRAVAGRLPSRARLSGAVEAPPDLVLLGQEPPFSDRDTLAQVLAAALRPLREAVAAVETLAGRLEDPAAGAAYAEALERAELHDAWDADRRARVAAARLGLGAIDGTRPVGTLSGGERTRLALAAIMTARPSVLLLDEPTNHLDDEAIDLLTAFLSDLPGVVLLASHDRVLLDDVCTDLVDLDPSAFGTDGAGGRRFGGGWTAYEEERASARRRWESAWTAQREEVDRLRALTRLGAESVAHGRAPRDNDKFIHAFKGARVQQTAARRKKDAERRLEIAERDRVPRPPRPLSFTAPLTSAAATGVVVQVRDLAVPARLRLDRLDVVSGEHLLVTGVNGAGKSTLLGVLAGSVAPGRGEVTVRARRVALLAQDVVFADPRRSARATYAAHAGDGAPSLAELGLLRREDHARPVGLLSVGQRRRLGLAVAIALAPDLLLLDEPTNHLSLTLAGELEEALGRSPGTVVVASHDRWLRRRWSGSERRLGTWPPRDRRP